MLTHINANKETNQISILGSAGGVGLALLSVLNVSLRDTTYSIYSYLNNSIINLIDIKQKSLLDYEREYPYLKGKLRTYEFNVSDTENLQCHFEETNPKMVVDCSLVDTFHTLNLCNELGIYYINTAIECSEENRRDMDKQKTIQQMIQLFESKRHLYQNTKSLIGSGMNSGVVQWMAVELWKEHPNEKAIACYIVEEDTGFPEDTEIIDSDTIYLSWCPDNYIEEAAFNLPMFMSNHKVSYLSIDDVLGSFQVRLGEREFNASLVPHEEVVTLGKLFDGEIGFLYRINAHSTNLLRKYSKHKEKVEELDKVVLQPQKIKIKGSDTVGILMVYEDKERFLYNESIHQDIYNSYKTNATYYQVACGIYAGLCSLLFTDIDNKSYYVEELLLETKAEYGKYLKEHMPNFVSGENPISNRLLIDRKIP